MISTRTVMGGKNPFMGIAYIVVGGICVILGLVFTVAHLIKPRYVGNIWPTPSFILIKYPLIGSLATIRTSLGTTKSLAQPRQRDGIIDTVRTLNRTLYLIHSPFFPRYLFSKLSSFHPGVARRFRLSPLCGISKCIM